jgi:eukaryotic-like serine/threonine-protein kinase
MATMFGRFEIQSELSKTNTALIYKAIDTKTEQVVALKTQSLEPLGERSAAFVGTLIAEGEKTHDLVSQNIVVLYGAGEIEGQFCAAMEYIQGNSIATMLGRNEGFSIWDLLDITRQVCAGLDIAALKGVAHCSLEPAKIMVQWDGMVKILGYGISNMSLIEAEAGNGLGRLMSYCSPEQIRGEAIDQRSNLFTLGTILYEMVVGRKAFDGADPVVLLSQIENVMPAIPSSVNAKIHPVVSALIMKALAKDPAERYQNARELLDDLEKCKENGKKPATETKKAANATVSSASRSAAASKFVSGASLPNPERSVQAATGKGNASPKIDAPAVLPPNLVVVGCHGARVQGKHGFVRCEVRFELGCGRCIPG